VAVRCAGRAQKLNGGRKSALRLGGLRPHVVERADRSPGAQEAACVLVSQDSLKSAFSSYSSPKSVCPGFPGSLDQSSSYKSRNLLPSLIQPHAIRLPAVRRCLSRRTTSPRGPWHVIPRIRDLDSVQRRLLPLSQRVSLGHDVDELDVHSIVGPKPRVGSFPSGCTETSH
jgi:hypothetical protein